jgi:hypothetical protein
MPRGPKGEKRPADVIGAGVMVAAFSKKLENHYHALSLYFVFYNFVRLHKAHRMTPAMAAGIADRLWSMEDIVGLVHDAEIAAIIRKRTLSSGLPHSN